MKRSLDVGRVKIINMHNPDSDSEVVNWTHEENMKEN